MLKIVFLLVSVQIAIVCGASAKPSSNRRVCVVGAGVAGLSMARYLAEEGLRFTVLEATGHVGGTWRYDPRTGHDEHGLPIFTSMYKDLRTNLPKPTMELPGFPLPKDSPSYPPWNVYYDYLKAYAKHFDLYKHIQFLSLVTSVTRVGDEWRVRHRNVSSGEEVEGMYDFVVIGNGHHSKPNRPSYPGEHLFKGSIIHSHDYREMTPYKDKRVLVVGAGPSGMDVALLLAEVATSVLHSHHYRPFRTPFPSNYVKKPDVKEFNETGVFFDDGSYEEIDDVIYCTGFQFDYPFLDASSGLAVAARSVTPLYRHAVNIRQPSMVLLGLVVRACLVVAIDAQARYATALVKGNFTLPSQADMMAEWQARADELAAKNRRLSDIHFLSENEDQYYEALTRESGIARVPPVLARIRARDTAARLQNLYTYRAYEYSVLDRHTFARRLAVQDDARASNDVIAP